MPPAPGSKSNSLQEGTSMKRFVIVLVCSALAFGGCNRRKAQKEEGESHADSASKDNLIEMSVSAQQYVGMVVELAAVTQLNEYLRSPALSNRLIAKSESLLLWPWKKG
jgi:hypothetical protein